MTDLFVVLFLFGGRGVVGISCFCVFFRFYLGDIVFRLTFFLEKDRFGRFFFCEVFGVLLW